MDDDQGVQAVSYVWSVASWNVGVLRVVLSVGEDGGGSAFHVGDVDLFCETDLNRVA